MLSLLATLIILGVIFYFVMLIPMAEPFPQIIRAIAILAALVIVLDFLGVHLLPLA